MAEFLRLFSNSPDRNFRTIFEQFRTEFGFGFDPKTDVCEFCGVFCYPNNSVTNCEGTKMCPILCGSVIWVILCVIVVKYYIINMLLCVKKIMLIYAI